ARQLPGERPFDLRQLPYSAWSGGCLCHGQAALGRSAGVGPANLQGEGRQHYAGQGNRHRQRAVTRGERKDGTKLKPPMGFPLYATMTDSDLNDLIAYLRTVPAKE